MLLSSRQEKTYRLAILLSTGKPVPADEMITLLDCSHPTLTRVLKELRETYSVQIKYSKANHSYQLTHVGGLDKKTLGWMNKALLSHAEIKANDEVSWVSLDKDKKKNVSLSLRMSVLRKIDRLAHLTNDTRSDIVEKIVLAYVDQFAKSQSKKKPKN